MGGADGSTELWRHPHHSVCLGLTIEVCECTNLTALDQLLYISGERMLARECDTMPRHLHDRVLAVTRAKVRRDFLEVVQDRLCRGPLQLHNEALPHPARQGVR